MNTLVLTRPDDWHLHLRDGALLRAVAPYSARFFARALIMPNLSTPVTTVAAASSYRERILAACPPNSNFTPWMSLYLTEETKAEEIDKAVASGFVLAAKLYPAGATTNSASGVRNFDHLRPVLERMATLGLTLCVHGEVTDPDIDIFDREAVFIERVLEPIRRATPGLRVTLEHVTTKDGLDYVREGGNDIAASITTHHLLINRNHILANGIRPHYYCLPIPKRALHQKALIEAAISGNPCFFSGTDSAPHVDSAKESACGCAGCFTAPNTLPCLAHIFEANGAIDKLEGFLSSHGAAHYRLPRNTQKIKLVKEKKPVEFPNEILAESEKITIFEPNVPLYWRVSDKHDGMV